MKTYKNHLVILGSARSGTSWLSELIARQHRYRLLFEPEHEYNTAKGHLLCDRYLQPVNNEAVKHYLKKVFSNRVDNDWIAQSSNRKWKRHLWPFIPKKFIIKFVRCNLGLEYFRKEFDMPVVFILRNPYDVLASQQRVKFPWLYDLKFFLEDETLKDLILEHYGLNLGNLKELTDLEKLALRWSIENSIPFLKLSKEVVSFYKLEDLKKNRDLFLNICKEKRLEPLGNLEQVYKQPSSKTHPRSKIRTGENPDSKFTKEEFEKINYFLDIFKIDTYPRIYS